MEELLKLLITCIDNNIELDVIPDPCFKSVSIRLFNRDVYKEAVLYYSRARLEREGPDLNLIKMEIADTIENLKRGKG